MINLWYDYTFKTFGVNNLAIGNRVKSQSKSFLRYYAELPKFLKEYTDVAFSIKSTNNDNCNTTGKHYYPIELLYFNGSWSFEISDAITFYNKCKNHNAEFLIWYPHEGFEYKDHPDSIFHRLHQTYPEIKITFVFGFLNRPKELPDFINYCGFDFFQYLHAKDTVDIDPNKSSSFDFLNIIGRLTPQRAYVYYQLLKSNRLENAKSAFHCYGDVDVISVVNFLKEYNVYSDDMVEWLTLLKKDDTHLQRSASISQNENKLLYNGTFLELVQETLFDSSGNLFITEKTYRPIVYGSIFLICGQLGTLNYLKTRGVETFDDLFDESYDTEQCWVSRWKIIEQNVKTWQCMSADSQKKYYQKNYDKLIHNQTVVYNTDKTPRPFL